jgi:hypothetical protein
MLDSEYIHQKERKLIVKVDHMMGGAKILMNGFLHTVQELPNFNPMLKNGLRDRFQLLMKHFLTFQQIFCTMKAKNLFLLFLDLRNTSHHYS